MNCMADARILELLTALTRDPVRRSASAAELAQGLGADDLLILLPDPAHGVYLPAFGFPQTLFGGRLWREFVLQAIAKSFATAELSYPVAQRRRKARGWVANDNSILVLFDGQPDPARVEMVRSLLPLITTTFEGERAAIAAAGQTKIAQQTAQQARELAEALDSVRRQLQSTIALREEDLSRRRGIEEDLARSNTDLQRFAYVAAHDLQEPLRTMVTYSQLLVQRHGATLPGEAHELLDVIVKGGVRMQELIHGLLSYAQVSGPFSTVPTDASIALEIAITDLRSKIEETQATVTHDVLPIVLGEQTQLIRLFANLLSNALKYRGERAPQIHVSCVRRESEYVFSVQDNGIGIDAKYQDQIFGLFQRLHSREYPGTGLGLATCRRIVERLGGKIWVESQPGEGAKFSFSLPSAD
jgi:signal transduction histidine kinase